MTKTLRLLLLEDNPADAELIIDALARAGIEVVAQRVDQKDAFTRALREFEPNVVISDHGLGQFNARAAMRALQTIRPTVPLIVVSGSLEDQAAVTSLRAGAEDVILKGNFDRLAPAIELALRVRRKLGELSPRQLEVLRLVVDGQTTREIAKQLKLSVKTVETHRGEIAKRLGIHRLVDLVRYAVRVGLVSSEPDPRHV